MRKLAVIALALAISGCGKDEKGGGKSSAKASAGKKSEDVSALFTGTAPTLPAEIAGLKLGQSKADAAKALGEDPGYNPSKTFDKVTYDTRFDKDKTTGAETLSQISVRTNTALEPLLTKLWGPPVKTDKSPFWFNPATGMRAHLPDHGKGETVAFDAYEPVEKILGEKGNAFAFAPDGKPLIGMTLAEFKTAMGPKLCRWDEQGPEAEKAYAEAAASWNNSLRDARRTINICTPVPRTVELYTGLGDDARFGMDGKLESIHISFQTGKSAEIIKQLSGAFDKAFGGKPVEIKEKSGSITRIYLDPTTKMRARVSLGADWVGLSYGWYLPLTELFGGDKPGLSIEGPHMPVGTMAEIKADDPTHYVQFGQDKDAIESLYYPPTDFNGQHVDVDLLIYAHEKKTYGYRINLHHTDNEAAGDQVFELLKAKFGEPKVDKQRTTDVDKYWTFSKNGRKVSARRVSQTWQIEVTK